MFKVITDKNGYVKSLIHNEGDIDIDLNKLDLEFLNAYQLIDGELVLDETKKQTMIDEQSKQAKAEQIAELKQELASTDYQIIKCSECQLLGQDMPYDVAELHEQRQAIRDKINKLEE